MRGFLCERPVRLLLIGSLLIVPPAGAQQASAPAPATAPELVSDADRELRDTLMTLERQYWQAMNARDAETIRKIMSPDGVFINGAAVYYPTQRLIDVIMRVKIEPVFGDRVLVRRLGPDAGVIAYDVRQRPDSPILWAVTAVYYRTNGQWIGVYHHEAIPRTGRPQQPPSPAPGATQ